MKKLYFILACVIGMMTVACTSDDDFGTEVSLLEKNLATYGTKPTTINIYTGQKQITTRGCDVNGNMWPSTPAVPTADEVNAVLIYIASNSDKGVEWPGWTYYYIQHVGGAHHMYSYKDWNGAEHNGIDGSSSQEYLQVLENSGNWQHVYNFNAGKCDNAATGNAALMTDGFNGAKTLSEYASSTVQNWRLFKFKGEYYLGLDYSQKKGDGEIPADGIYDDWVVKIIPGAGEIIPENPTDPEDPTDDPTDPTDPTDDPADPTVQGGSVEFDVHQQEHNSWKEIKTSIHLRDTVNVRIFIPIEKEYQAVADDFDIRNGQDYFYIEEVEQSKFTIAGKEYTVETHINHTDAGIEILIGGAEMAQALKDARGIYDDGLTFEIHSYVYPNVTDEQIWSWLKQVECAQTSMSKWPVSGDCVTHTYGQVTSAFFEDSNNFVKDPE